MDIQSCGHDRAGSGDEEGSRQIEDAFVAGGLAPPRAASAEHDEARLAELDSALGRTPPGKGFVLRDFRPRRPRSADVLGVPRFAASIHGYGLEAFAQLVHPDRPVPVPLPRDAPVVRVLHLSPAQAAQARPQSSR